MVKDTNKAWLTLSGLILCLFLLSGCQKKEQEITVLWDDVNAVGIVIPFRLLDAVDKDSLRNQFTIKVDGNFNQPVLGEWIIDNNQLIFHPLVSFTSGIKYE